MARHMGINGVGRIGRVRLRYDLTFPDVEVVAITDLADISGLACLLK